MELKDLEERWKNEDVIELLLKDLEKTVKRDEHVKLAVFLTALSAYTDEPLNLFLKGESGSGKSYNVTQVVKRYFPPEDVWLLGGMSPKNLIHLGGIEMAGDGRRVDEIPRPKKPGKKATEEEIQEYEAQMREYRELMKNSYVLIDISSKILVFLEAPEQESYRNLYPILSHDSREISYQFVDKTGKGQLKSKKVVIRGWPACIFCTPDVKYVEELATRSLSVTPEQSSEKIALAQEVATQKAAFPWLDNESDDTKFIRQIISHIKAIASEYKVLIPFCNLSEIFPKYAVRHMRDFNHFIGIIKVITLLYFPRRAKVQINGQKYVLSSAEDVVRAARLFKRIYETTQTGTEETVLSFYWNLVVKRDEWHAETLMEEYNKTNRKVSKKTITRWLHRLEDIGYVSSEPDPSDRRRLIFKPMIRQEIETIKDSPDLLAPLLEKGFREWLNKSGHEYPPEIKEYVLIMPKGGLEQQYIIRDMTSCPDLSGKLGEESGKDELVNKDSPEMSLFPSSLSDLEQQRTTQVSSPSLSQQHEYIIRDTISCPDLSRKPDEESSQNKPTNKDSPQLSLSPKLSPELEEKWNNIGKMLHKLEAEACKMCAFYETCEDRSGICKKYKYKYDVLEKKRAVNELAHKMTYEDKIKELGTGWTAYSLPKPRTCAICGSEAILAVRRWIGEEMEQKELCLQCFSLLKKMGGVLR